MPSRPDPYALPPNAALTRAEHVPPTPPEWIWPARIPNAQLTLLVGDPGTGKSLLAAELAARISAPKPWPDNAIVIESETDPGGCPFQRGCHAFTGASPGKHALDDRRHALDDGRHALDDGRHALDDGCHAFTGASPGKHALDDGRHADGCSRRHAVNDAPEPNHRFPWTPNPYFRNDDETASSRHPHAGAAIIASPEDHAAQILIPRLKAAGANLTRVSVLYGVTPSDYPDGPVSPLILPDHVRVLQGAACQTFNARLLVLDPLHALLSTAAQCCPAVLARLLADLADFARKFNIAVLATVHLAKTQRTKTLHNIRGSIALTAAARAAHLLTTDPVDPDRRILSPLKSVYGPPPPALAFKIKPGPRVDWERNPVPAPAELLDNAADSRSALTEACEWLSDHLQNGPRPAREVIPAASRDGIRPFTLYRARRLLNIRSKKSSDGRWVWTKTAPKQPDFNCLRAPGNADFEELQQEGV